MNQEELKDLISEIKNGESVFNKEALLLIMCQDAQILEEIFKTINTVGYTEGKILLQDYFDSLEKK